MNKKMKHVLLALCVCIFGLMMTGCGSAINTTVKLTSATKATCTIEQGYDDEMLDGLASMSEMTKKELINELKGSGAKYSKKKISSSLSMCSLLKVVIFAIMWRMLFICQ